MRGSVRFLVLSAILVAAWLGGPATRASAASYDGNWTVLIVTEKGDCDRAYRYEVSVAGGRVRYAGDNDFNLGGTVAADGAVQVSIRRGNRGASGSGHLTDQTGEGIWHGIGSSGGCSGRWEAERR
jgi:hypothetical protein